MGGTIGAPYEGKREVLDIKGFATKKGEVLPNDDLDLQLVWLHAVEFETFFFQFVDDFIPVVKLG